MSRMQTDRASVRIADLVNPASNLVHPVQQEHLSVACSDLDCGQMAGFA